MRRPAILAILVAGLAVVGEAGKGRAGFGKRSLNQVPSGMTLGPTTIEAPTTGGDHPDTAKITIGKQLGKWLDRHPLSKFETYILHPIYRNERGEPPVFIPLHHMNDPTHSLSFPLSLAPRLPQVKEYRLFSCHQIFLELLQPLTDIIYVRWKDLSREAVSKTRQLFRRRMLKIIALWKAKTAVESTANCHPESQAAVNRALAELKALISIPLKAGQTQVHSKLADAFLELIKIPLLRIVGHVLKSNCPPYLPDLTPIKDPKDGTPIFPTALDVHLALQNAEFLGSLAFSNKQSREPQDADSSGITHLKLLLGRIDNLSGAKTGLHLAWALYKQRQQEGDSISNEFFELFEQALTKIEWGKRQGDHSLWIATVLSKLHVCHSSTQTITDWESNNAALILRRLYWDFDVRSVYQDMIFAQDGLLRFLPLLGVLNGDYFEDGGEGAMDSLGPAPLTSRWALPDQEMPHELGGPEDCTHLLPWSLGLDDMFPELMSPIEEGSEHEWAPQEGQHDDEKVPICQLEVATLPREDAAFDAILTDMEHGLEVLAIKGAPNPIWNEDDDIWKEVEAALVPGSSATARELLVAFDLFLWVQDRSIFATSWNAITLPARIKSYFDLALSFIRPVESFPHGSAQALALSVGPYALRYWLAMSRDKPNHNESNLFQQINYELWGKMDDLQCLAVLLREFPLLRKTTTPRESRNGLLAPELLLDDKNCPGKRIGKLRLLMELAQDPTTIEGAPLIVISFDFAELILNLDSHDILEIVQLMAYVHLGTPPRTIPLAYEDWLAMHQCAASDTSADMSDKVFIILESMQKLWCLFFSGYHGATIPPSIAMW